MLIEEAYLKFTIYYSISFKNVDLSGQGFDKCRFTSSIWSYEGNSGVHINVKVDTFNNWDVFSVSEYTVSDS